MRATWSSTVGIGESLSMHSGRPDATLSVRCFATQTGTHGSCGDDVSSRAGMTWPGGAAVCSWPGGAHMHRTSP